MTETPGASNVMNQPLTPEAAGARRAALMADPEFQSRVAAKDAAAFEEHTKLWRVEHGMTPEPVPPETVTDVFAGMSEREIAEQDARVETWGKFIDNFDDVKRATIARGLATKQQSEEAKRELARMKADPAFGRRVLSGDNAARDVWARVNLVASMRVVPDDFDWSK